MNNGVFSRMRALKAKGMCFGTKRTRSILDSLGSPDKKLKIIHIAGTNGKGSVAEFITRILVAAGKRVGTFTSPEVYSYFDQFRIDGENMTEEELYKSFESALAAAERFGATSFEAETAGALLAFANSGCEYAVIECGLGGLNDATNAVAEKQVAIITAVSLEHTAILGDTVTQICSQKAGIIKNCPAVVSCSLPDESKEYLIKNFRDSVIFTQKPENYDGKGFIYKGKPFSLFAQGGMQPYNAACAIEAARLLNIDEHAIYSGIKAANPLGRLEIIEACGTTYVLDGAHNPAAFAPLSGLLRGDKINGDRTIIYGSLSDKDIDGNLKNLAGLAEKIIAVKCESPRAADLAATEEACRRYFKEVRSAQSVSQALDAAKTQAVIVCGSFTLLKEAKQWIEKRL